MCAGECAAGSRVRRRGCGRGDAVERGGGGLSHGQDPLQRVPDVAHARLRRVAYAPSTAMKKLRIVILRFGTAGQKMVLERWTNPKPLCKIADRAAT
jgi:hypothetical protein